MKIGIDAGALGGENPFKSGNYYLALNILKNLNKTDKNRNIYNLYTYEPIDNTVLKELGKNFVNVVVGPKHLWMLFGLPVALVKSPVDLFIGFNQCLPLIFRGRTVVFVLDLAYKTYPDLFNNFCKISLMTRLAINKADAVIAISESTKKDIVKYCNFDKKKIKVIYPGI